MNILNGIKNFLMLVDEHWLEIAIAIGMGMRVYAKIKAYMRSSDEMKEIAKKEAIERTKRNISEIMLKYVCRAEYDYAEWVKAGAAKRAEVIDKILYSYPILQDAADRDDIIAFIDSAINDALKTMREMVKEKEKVQEY